MSELRASRFVMRLLGAGWKIGLNGSVTSLAAALMWLAQPHHALAYGGLDNYQLSREEVALLPEFCRHTQLIIQQHGSDTSQREWVQRVGPGFMHMHHYCIAVIAYVRSFRHSNKPADRSGYLGFALINLDYVLRNVEPEFAFVPEVLYRRGQVRLRQGDVTGAQKNLEDAVRADPKHARASYELSQIALAAGNRARAISILTEALERSPDSRLLKTALADLKAHKASK